MPDSPLTERLLDPEVLASIGRLDLVARTVVEGFLIGLHRSPYRGLSQEFAEHRPYIAGDEVRRIDWRVYARTDRLYVKEFEEETNAPVRLLLDVSGSLGYTPRRVSKLEYARFLVAALAYLATKQNDRVGLVCFDEEIRLRLRTRGGERHLHTILATLEETKAGGRTRTGACLLSEAAQWKRRGLAVLVSDLYDDGPEVVNAVARLRRVGHDVIVFHLLDGAEKSLSERGTYEFHDLETGETLLADADRVRKSYIEQMAQLRSFFRREFERAGADYAELDPSEPLDRALAVYLRRRKARTKGGARQR
ncbi:MAG TPA: DUF58 domain-containing protein [Pyrinomonadaceae bacterium]|jgi:uncharacterized protein (DUF58 family)|nr:DUF58 domain-containing protein [Pyrinomonadaceae bacterium]